MNNEHEKEGLLDKEHKGVREGILFSIHVLEANLIFASSPKIGSMCVIRSSCLDVKATHSRHIISESIVHA